MRATIALALLIMLAGVVPALAADQGKEELFDTKAATASMEDGISLLNAKKYDAAIEKFEDAAATDPDLEAEAYYYEGYAYYMKGKAGDEDSTQKSIELFKQAYEINPNFSPNKYKPAEPVPGPAAQQGEESTPAAAAPAGTLNIPPAQAEPKAAPAGQESGPDGQQSQVTPTAQIPF